MFAVIDCLERHDPRLLVWAILMCLTSVVAGLSAYRRAAATQGGHRRAWLSIMAVLLGSGVWATHFIAMLAYRRELQIGFSSGLTFLSMMVSIVGLGLGAGIAATSSGAKGRALGGAVCGLAIAGMHFTGVAGLHVPAITIWNRELVAIAILISLVAGAGAFAVAGREPDLKRGIAATGLLTTAICGLHFTGMAALVLIPRSIIIGAEAFGRDQLAIGVGVLAGMLLISGVGLLLMDRFSTRSAQSDLNSALDCAPSGIARFSRDKLLQSWNRQYAEFMESYGLTAAVGLQYSAIVQAAVRFSSPTEGPVAFASTGDGVPSRKDAFPAPGGRWVQARMGAVADGGFIAVITDITEQLEARQAAEAGSRAKSEFLANMSHEIRTPLNGVLGMVQIMARDELAPAQKDRLDVIRDSGQSLLTILDSILDISKIETGQLEIAAHAFDLEDAVSRAARPFAELAKQKGLLFSLSVSPEAAGAWVGDEERLRQVLTNLLSNALKFTPQGAISLRVDAEADGLGFQVADTGVGVGADKLDLIFETFTQGDSSSKREFGGTGLGLPICRQLVELMGGRMTAHSQVGVGSTFGFNLPLTRAAETAPAADVAHASHTPEASGGERLRLLAAEDNPTNQMILKALLEPFGIDLTMVENGRQAVDAMEHAHFDLVLMDIQMPEMDGVEAAAAIRRHEVEHGERRTPIVAVTANVMAHQVETYRVAGMDGCVPKPLQTETLLAAIEAALDEASVNEAFPADQLPGEAGSGTA